MCAAQAVAAHRRKWKAGFVKCTSASATSTSEFGIAGWTFQELMDWNKKDYMMQEAPCLRSSWVALIVQSLLMLRYAHPASFLFVMVPDQRGWVVTERVS